MQKLKSVIEWLSTLPVWLRAALILVVAVATMLLTLSCGTPKTIATVQNVNPNSTVTVSMTVSNSTTSTPTVETTTPSLNH